MVSISHTWKSAEPRTQETGWGFPSLNQSEATGGIFRHISTTHKELDLSKDSGDGGFPILQLGYAIFSPSSLFM